MEGGRTDTGLRFYHCNHSVTDMDRSIRFYREQFGLEPVREIRAYEGAMRLSFLSDAHTGFLLELTWYREHPEPFALGDKEFHVAFTTSDYDYWLARHKVAGIVVKEEPDLRLYFVEDLDGYQIEIVEQRNKEADKV